MDYIWWQLGSGKDFEWGWSWHSNSLLLEGDDSLEWTLLLDGLTVEKVGIWYPIFCNVNFSVNLTHLCYHISLYLNKNSFTEDKKENKYYKY